jgi:hypothetical protein
MDTPITFMIFRSVISLAQASRAALAAYIGPAFIVCQYENHMSTALSNACGSRPEA